MEAKIFLPEEELTIMSEPEKWSITSDEQAESYVEFKEDELVEIRRYKMSLENKIALLQSRLDKAKEEEKDIIDNRDYHLRQYFETKEDAELKKTKTLSKYRLPSVELVMKIQAPEFKRNNDKLTEWLLSSELEQFVTSKVTVTPNWSDLKKEIKVVGDTLVYTPTGEVVEGIDVIERLPEFKVEMK